ncbi:probable LRR receptor-like serine/threonine-protein kinase At3g47570 [Cajanus cajan]|uniref:probable LRR receptor-like serine/threonine-protein kinase At3g47570 n=1 Tax=Cajanus cajan TaxID=3821 RepID=UPI0010FBBD7E|nr:probable LRR receptor-like serine/threonine-protein kinase At3g47570 [Cajanus cajan]
MMSSVVWSICLVMLLLFTSNSWSQHIITTYALGNETDHSALLKFKESISDDPFGVFNSWNSSSHFCMWHGVTCNPRHQRVIELNLTGYHLHGFISPHIGNLSFLRILLLEDNSFYGEVPQELGRLFRLYVLYFTNNTLGGEFPINLSNCSKLSHLSLEGNNFFGEIPRKIESFANLKELCIRKNNLIGHIPPSIGNLSSLTRLSLSANKLEGKIPKEIGSLENLRILGMSGNKLSGDIPLSLYNLSSLIVFSITNNHISGSFPTNMFLTLPNIKTFTVSGNQLSGLIPTSISNASGIQILDIGGNHLVGQVPSLVKLQDISTLQLSLNNLGSFPSFVGNYTVKLTQLMAGGNKFIGKIPMELGNLVNLIVLAMEKNHLTGIIPATFCKLQKIQLFSLGENKLFGEIPPSIGNLSQLYYLELSSNMFVGNIPSTIGNCQHLQFLHLAANNITGAIPSQVFEIPSLSTTLNLSYNSLSGNLPVEVGMLKNIELLDVSENYISGVIPETIGECITLEYLNLEGNSFHGSIPTSLASLKGLKYLDLSRNNLSGSIPERIQNISVLEYFNASFNMLEGDVPKGGVFQNASAISVIGNGKLCGGVSELKLPPCALKAKKRRKHRDLKLIVVIICLVLFLPILSCIFGMYLIRKRHKKSSTNRTIDQLPKVSYQNLHHATDGFSLRNLIGKGSHGSVYKGSLESTEKIVAIKVLNLQTKGANKSFIAECEALRNVRHRNLVKVVTCCSSVDHNGNDFKALVFQYMSNRSLEEWLHPQNGNTERPKRLNLETRLGILIGVTSALHYLHHECEEPIIHCDLKPSNILLDDDMVAHVSDFGIARLLSTINHYQISTSGIKGTIGYSPPEYGSSSQVSTKGDMYSFGILILEMLTGRRPTEEMFKDGHNLHNYVKIAFPNNFLEIVDATLISMEIEYPTITISEQNNISEIVDHMHPNTKKCLFSLFRIGLACSVEPPGERMNMMEVTRELNMIRNAFYARRMRDIGGASTSGSMVMMPMAVPVEVRSGTFWKG